MVILQIQVQMIYVKSGREQKSFDSKFSTLFCFPALSHWWGGLYSTLQQRNWWSTEQHIKLANATRHRSDISPYDSVLEKYQLDLEGTEAYLVQLPLF